MKREADEWLELRPAGRFISFEEAVPAVALIVSLVGLVLVAACMNLGLLVLARTLGRDREFAIRLSVGATRGRIVRQLLTEHLLLGVLGAAVACFVAVLATRAVLSMTGTSGGMTPQINIRMIIAAAVLAVVSSVAFGFAPAWQALRPAGARRLRLRTVLVGLQVMAAITLLIVSGLLVRGVTRVVRVPLGFDYQQTLVADPHLSSHGMSPEAAQAYWDGVDARLRQVPGIRNVASDLSPSLWRPRLGEPRGDDFLSRDTGVLRDDADSAQAWSRLQCSVRRGSCSSVKRSRAGVGRPGTPSASVRGPHRDRCRWRCPHRPRRRSIGNGMLFPDRSEANWRKQSWSFAPTPRQAVRRPPFAPSCAPMTRG